MEIKSRRLQWMLLAGSVSLLSLGAIVLFERSSMDIAEVLLAPWFVICRVVTPLAWQVRGNILLGMMWLFSGIVIYSMLMSGVVVACLALWQGKRQLGTCPEKYDQSHEVVSTRNYIGYVLIFLALFSVLVILASTTVAGGEKNPPSSQQLVVPVIAAYEGRIHAMVVDKDLRQVSGPTEITIRNQADYEAFVARIPSRQVTRTNPAPPSQDPLLKKPCINFDKNMMLVVIRPDNMYVTSQFVSVLLDKEILQVHVRDPHPGDTTFYSQPQGVGTYRALVVRKHKGAVRFQRKQGQPIPQDPKLIAEPVIARGARAEVLDGRQPDATILKLIERYHQVGRSNEQARKELFTQPREKVQQQLLLLLASDDLLIWKHYSFNPGNGSSSKNVYTTVLRLLLEHYGSRQECRSVQEFLVRILIHDSKNHMFFTTEYCCEFLGKYRDDSSVPVLVKALDHPGEYSLWFAGKDRSQPADYTRTVRGEALHALERIVGDQVSSYVVKGETAPGSKPREQWIKEAKQWWANIGARETRYGKVPAELRGLIRDQPSPGKGTQE